jgi:hypothetical protein
MDRFRKGFANITLNGDEEETACGEELPEEDREALEAFVPEVGEGTHEVDGQPRSRHHARACDEGLDGPRPCPEAASEAARADPVSASD